jgi:cytosine deaminase
MMLDLVLRRADLDDGNGPTDIGFAGTRIAAMGRDLACEAAEIDLAGRLVLPGLVDTHVHLDKSCLDKRCPCGSGSLVEAVKSVAEAKRGFTEEDVYGRARRTLEMAVRHGTNRMRTHVEVDPRVGLTSFKALQRLKRDAAWAVELQLCVFPQEGLLDDPGCDAVLVEALDLGADLIGGAPYIDRDSHGQIARIFDLAQRRDLDVDLHLDFSLDAAALDVDEVCRQTEARALGGRVAIGHVTKLSALPPERFDRYARRLADAGVAVTVLPATDLFLMGRGADHDVPRGVAPAHRLMHAGVTCSVATNNVRNPFTPYGDGSLVRMTNLFANVAQLGGEEDLVDCLDLVTRGAARLMRLDDYGIVVGGPATLIAFDAESRADIVAGIIQPEIGFKNGRQTFERPPARLVGPGARDMKRHL